MTESKQTVQKPEVAQAIVDGFKRAGIDFVVIATPEPQYDAVIPLIANDPSFQYVPALQEAQGAAICAGAWAGGKKPAFILTSAGYYPMLWEFAAQSVLWGIPFIFLIPHLGDVGCPWWVMSIRDSHCMTQTMEVFGVPYTVVERVQDLSTEIVRAHVHAGASLRPVGLLLGGETVWTY